MAMQKIFAREILDSRGNPTVEVDLHTAKGNTGPLNGFTWEDPQLHLPLPPNSMPHPLLSLGSPLPACSPAGSSTNLSTQPPAPGLREETISPLGG